jgi:hypothetical protein
MRYPLQKAVSAPQVPLVRCRVDFYFVDSSCCSLGTCLVLLCRRVGGALAFLFFIIERTFSMRSFLTAVVVVLVATLSVVGCSPMGENASPTVPSVVSAESQAIIGLVGNGFPVANTIKVNKLGNVGGSFNVVAVSGTATVAGPAYPINSGTFNIVAESTTSATISVTESPATNLQYAFAIDAPGSHVAYSNGDSLTIDPTHGYSIYVTNAASNSMACGPGYWKQSKHLDSWSGTGFAPGDDLDAAFGLPPGDALTLLQALELKGGNGNKHGFHAIARQAVAALLSAGKGIGYPLAVGALVNPSFNSVRGVIRRVDNGLFPLEDASGLLEALNSNFRCPLN